jgi:hypothetical protein
MPYAKLTRSTIASLTRNKHTGRVNDGAGLYLEMQGGTGFWIFRWKRLGKQHYMGLGPLHTVTAENSRAAALAARKDLREGRDPKVAREAARIAAQIEASKRVSFDDYSKGFIEDQAHTWANGASKKQWTNSLKTYCSPVFGHVPVRDVDTALIVEALRPIWHSKRETAARLRGRVEQILASATVAGYRPEGPNPARLKNHLDKLLPSRGKRAARPRPGTIRRCPMLRSASS